MGCEACHQFADQPLCVQYSQFLQCDFPDLRGGVIKRIDQERDGFRGRRIGQSQEPLDSRLGVRVLSHRLERD